MHEVFYLRAYDVSVTDTVSSIVDAGANVGYASLFFAAKYPSAKIFAIEPDDANCALFRRNLAEFPNVTLFRGALWSKAVPVVIENPDESSHGFRVTETNQQMGRAIPGIDMPTIVENLGSGPYRHSQDRYRGSRAQGLR
jgi:FkbM family methyltransferase